jgi:hypothetical protein
MNKLEPKIIKRKYWDQEQQRFLFSYIFFEDIPDEYKDEFRKWLGGQTCPVIEGCETQTAIYWYDWIRWYRFKTGKARYLIFD